MDSKELIAALNQAKADLNFANTKLDAQSQKLDLINIKVQELVTAVINCGTLPDEVVIAVEGIKLATASITDEVEEASGKIDKTATDAGL